MFCYTVQGCPNVPMCNNFMPENVNTLKFRSVHSLPLSLTPFPCSLVSPFGTRKVFEFSVHILMMWD